MRRLLLVLPLLASGCLSDAGLGSATVDGRPTATDEDGVSVTVLSVDPGDETTVDLLVINGTARPARLARASSPMTLTDGTGAELSGPEADLEVPAFSTDRVRATFAGRPSGERMTLTAGDLTLSDLPTGATMFAAGSAPALGDVARAQANHANGSTLRVTGVTFDEASTAVGVEAVNGHDRAITLNDHAGDVLHLADERGRRYPVVPPVTNGDLEIQPGMALRGTLRFAGRVPGDVRRLMLVANERYGGDQDYTTDPTFSIRLPLAE